jgi:hypothetical protein
MIFENFFEGNCEVYRLRMSRNRLSYIELKWPVAIGSRVSPQVLSQDPYQKSCHTKLRFAA